MPYENPSELKSIQKLKELLSIKQAKIEAKLIESPRTMRVAMKTGKETLVRMMQESSNRPNAYYAVPSPQKPKNTDQSIIKSEISEPGIHSATSL